MEDQEKRANALIWWKALDDIDKQFIASQIKPNWPLTAFNASTSHIVIAFNQYGHIDLNLNK